MAKALANVRHDYIRYANCWEDADLLIKGLKIEPGDRILSIASAGDNSLSLLTQDPELVVAVDINIAQLHLVRLKIAAFKALEHDEMLAFLGFAASNDRLELFKKVIPYLIPDCAKYWESHSESIAEGIIYQGKFEHYFQTFRKKLLPIIHSKAKVHQLFKAKSSEAQKEFCEKKWFNFRWVFLFKIFFSRPVMGALGRDPQFLREVHIRVSAFILNRAKEHLSSINCQNNYFLQFILLGKFQTQLPHFARKENFEIIKRRVDRISVFQGLAEDAFLSYPKFNKFNLSNIFEYMDQDLFRETVKQLVSHSEEGARFAYWNLMVERKMNQANSSLNPDPDFGRHLAEDCGFFYTDFNVSVNGR